ncbi:MAG: hypothetical protein INF92_13615 [Rhodobacter sp.]|nr:hypothetical protein [Rhodobacter sp.]
MIRGFLLRAGLSAAICAFGLPSWAACVTEKPVKAFLDIVSTAKDTMAADRPKEAEQAQRELLTGMVNRLMSAGLDSQAAALATHETGLGITAETATATAPAEAIATIRSLRLLATGFSPDTDLLESPSERAAWRLECLDQAERIADTLVGEIKDSIRARGTDPASSEALSVESAMSLLSLIHIEKSEVRRDRGDHVYRTIDVKEATGAEGELTRVNGSAQLALAHYRDAQLSLAVAMAGAGDDRLARIRLVGLDLEQRMDWLRQGRSFGGRSFDAPTRPIGFDLDKDALGFTILKDLDTSLKNLEQATTVYTDYQTSAHERLGNDFKSFAQFYGEAEAYRQTRLQTLFAELDRLDITEADLALDLSRIVEEQGKDTTDVDVRNAAEREEYEARRKTTARRAAETLPGIAAKLAALADLGPLDPPDVRTYRVPQNDPLWQEDAALFSRIFGNCGQPLTPAERPVLNASWAEVRSGGDAVKTGWSAERLQDLPAAYREVLEQTLGSQGLNDARLEVDTGFEKIKNAADLLLKTTDADQSQDAQLTRLWGESIQECWELGAQLQIERALLLNTRLDLKKKHLDQLYEMGRREAELSADALLAEANKLGQQGRALLVTQLRKAQEDIVKAATEQIRQKIDHTEKLLGEAQQIVEQVISTGQNVERAAKAADAVYSAMTAVPVGSGPGGVFFERDTLVALNNSAVDMARFTYRATNDVFVIKQQLASFEGKLRAYKEDLENLSLKKSAEAVERALAELETDTKAGFQKILDEAREAMIGNAERARARIESEAKDILSSAVILSDSRAALIEQQLEGVMAKLADLADRREALRQRQIFALRDLLVDMNRTLNLAREVSAAQADYEALLALQAETLEETRSRQATVMQRLREKDATLARRVEEIMEQIRRIRDGEDENPWSGGRNLALRLLAPPPQLDGDALEHAVILRRALDETGNQIFELAVALKYLTQSDKPLLYAVQPSSLNDATRLRDALKSLYRNHIRTILRPRVEVIALRITPEAAEAWGRVDGPNGREYPRCLDQDNPDARCLRVVTTYGPRWHWNGLTEKEEPLLAVSPLCDREVDLGKVLQPDPDTPQELGGAWVLGPANAPVSSPRSPDYCPENTPPDPSSLRPASSTGELVFMLDSLLGQENEGILVDTLVATSNLQMTDPTRLPTDLTPVGTTTVVCRQGEDLHQRLVNRPFQTIYEASDGPKPSTKAYTPRNGLTELKLASARFNKNPVEEFFGIDAAGRRALFFGRGLGNTFDLRLAKGAGIEDEIYVFLFVAYVRCDGRDGNVLAPSKQEYESDLDLVLTSDAFAGAPLARRLIDLERRLQLADSSRESRLDSLQALLAAGTALGVASGENDLDKLARKTLTANLDSYLAQVPEAPLRPMPEEPAALFRCAAEGQEDCRLAVKGASEGETAPFSAAPVNRPIPLARFEEVIRLAMEPDADSELGPLPGEVDTRLKELRETLDLLHDALDFLDRSVTTKRAVVRLEALAERRLAMLRDGVDMLRTVQPKPPLGLQEAACVDHFYSDPAYWLLEATEGGLAIENRQRDLVAGFLANCADFTAAATNQGCQALARAVETDEPVGNADDTDEACARRLGLGNDAIAFARALGRARSIMETAK